MTEAPRQVGAAPPGPWAVGHLTLDDVVQPDGSTTMGTVGGASVYAAVGARLAGLPMGIISRQGSDYPAEAAASLRRSGIPLQITRVPGRALSQWAIYERDGTRTFLLHPHSGDYADTSPSPEDPVDWGAISALHLAPMPLRFQLPWLRTAEAEGINQLTLDPHHDSSAEDPEAVLGVLPSVRAFLPSELEASRLHGSDPERAARDFVRGGADIAVVKIGPEGSLVAMDESVWHVSACTVDVIDPTGAGDAYCGAFLAALDRGDHPLDAARLATVAAALTMRQSGALAALPAPGPEVVADLLDSIEVRPATSRQPQAARGDEPQPTDRPTAKG